MKTISNSCNGILVGMALVGILGEVQSAVAQTSSSTSAQAQETTTAVVPVWRGGYWRGYGAGTVAEGYFRGQAELLRGAGEYNLYTSMAERNHQIAYEHALDNFQRRVDTYFDARRTNDLYRAESYRGAPTPEQASRWAKAEVPKRLGQQELDPALGKVLWPAALQGDEFTPYRERIERLFAGRGLDNSGLGTRNYRELKGVTDELREALRERADEMTSAEYIVARKFVESVAYEARFRPAIEGVAVR